MTKKYIDFVPAQKNTQAKKPVATRVAVRKPATVKPVVKLPTSTRSTAPSRARGVKDGLALKKKPKLGEIEDLNPKFVMKNVPKRPLGNEGEVKKAVPKKKTEAKRVFTVPNSPFINQDKVMKRPLSRNVYKKKAEAIVSREEKINKPVTIISKPEKESHVGVVVTIILTIIFGAVAGTVAFLLLPK